MQEVNYIAHLNSVFEHFSKDNRLNPTHISLYITLFRFWNANFFSDGFYINREEVMKYSKIGSTATYHKCIKELSQWNYIHYKPSHNPFKGSRVKLFNFEASTEQAVNNCHIKNQTSAKQALIPIIKHIQTIENFKNKPQNFKNSNSGFLKNKNKPAPLVQNRDNLRISTEKNYNEPL